MIKIYDINDKLLMQAEVTSAAKREQEMSKSDYITLSFSAAEKVILPVGAYINYTYKIDKVREVTRKFLLLESYEPIQTDECSWKYTPQFQHPKMILSKTPFFIYTRNSQNVEVKQNVWSFVGTTSVLSGKIADFLNKDLMFGECGWKVIFSNVMVNTVNVSFSDNDFISALTAITNAIGDNYEWHIDYDDEIIYIGKVLVGTTPVVLEVGKNVGVPNISNSKESYYNAFSIFGGTRNITQVNSKGENVSSGDIRLQLDEGNGTISIDGKERSYSIDKYSTLDLRADKTKEPLFTKVLDLSQIYPSLNTYVYNVRGRVKYVLDDNNKKIPISYNADGSVKEYKTFTVWYMKLSYPTTEKVEGKTIINTTVDDGVTHYWYDFEVTDDLLINGKNIGCSFEPNFNTGALSTPLAGRGSNGEYVGFELIYHKKASSSHTSDDVSKDNFSILAGDYEIIYQEDNEVIIPTNAAEMLIPRGESMPSLKCNITVLYNIAMTDTIYYEDAQNRLLEKAKEEIVRLLSDLNNYEIKSYSDVFLEDNPQLQIGQSVTYKDGHGYELATRVLKLSTNIDYDFIQSITIGNQVIKGTITQLKEDVQTIIASGGSSGNGGGYSVSQLRNLIAKYGSDNFISKQFDDIANGTITFQKVQKFLQGLHVGNSNNENGGSWTPDAEGRSHLITDYLEVRMKAIFETLEILHTDTSGGELFITPVGSNRILKVEEVNITYDGVSQKAYRCYFLGEQDGSKVENKWKVGDQARSKSFNLTQGKYHNVGNHYYWRLVIGVSTETVEIDGKKYHYVDLSDIDKDAASDEPMVDDILNQCGNRADNARQSCLVFSAVDTYSPSVTLYHGVNGYTFNNKEYVAYGVNHSTNKAFFHVYGDMYFGDRPTSANNYEGDSYVKYDSDKKKVTIKGDLDIKSTYDGKTLDKYITEKSLDKDAVETIIKKSETITDLQNQIDGAIETWFYEGVPTLDNAPAISWKTDKDKKTHLGDLYYDNKTGKAYRFAKDGSTYKWIIITDTELTKALEDSSQALKDAKSKRRIFGSQPVPPYDVNDMWVNATYPSDGSTYKNEILKCSTSKAEGEEFDIADWKLASKYTDDTKAEEAKKAAEKAQAEIKDTQTNLIALGTTVSNNKKAFDAFTSDGYLDSSEIAAIAQDSKRLEDDYNAAVESYNNVVGSKFLLDKDGNETTYKTDLVSAKATLDSAKNGLIHFLSDIVRRYNDSDSDEKAAIKVAAAQKYTNFTNAYKAFYDKLGVANNYITSNLFEGLNTKLITNMAGLEYIKAALVDGKNTEIKGGLVLTTLIALRNEKGDVTSGINGADTKENGIALWLGGKAIDRQASTTKEDEMDSAAKALLRFDGTGYFANGNLWWDADGTLHADPTSFIINKNNVGVQLALFAPVWKSGTTDTTKLANVLAIDPQKPFTHLDVSGNVTTEGSVKIGDIVLAYDSQNEALKVYRATNGKSANLYTTGGITAYGSSSVSGGGGGLNATVKLYEESIKLTSDSRELVASAYSIKALDSRISSLEGGSATAISVSGSGNAVTSVTKDGTTISVVKGSTFLTSHQSLDDYVNAISVSGSGNAITSVSKSRKGITFTKGATFLTSHQSLANYYTKSQVDNIANNKSDVGHTHNYLPYIGFNGGLYASTSSNAWGNTTGTAIAEWYDNTSGGLMFRKNNPSNGKMSMLIDGTVYINEGSEAVASQTWVTGKGYLTSHQSLADYAKKSDLPTTLPANGGNADTVDGEDASNFSYTHQNSFDFSKIKSGRIVTFDERNTNYGWINGFASTHNNYLTSVIFNTHRTSNWYVGYIEGSLSTGATNGLTAVKQLAFLDSKVADSDKLDGIHASGLLTALSNSDKGISITVGGTTKSVSNISVNYASSAGNADTLDGEHGIGYVRTRVNLYTTPNDIAKYVGGYIGMIVNNSSDNFPEGKNSDWHHIISANYNNSPNGSGNDGNYWCSQLINKAGSNKLYIRSRDGGNDITTGWTSWEQLARVSDNVASATKLQTPRTIWGQSFDGTGNVDGELVVNGGNVVCGIKINSDISEGSISFNGADGGYRWVTGRYNNRYFIWNNNNGEVFSIANNSNVGIGDVSPGYKLSVTGDIYSSATIRTSAHNQAIVLSNFSSPAWISALDGQVIFNTGNAIRFGETAWDWNQWAGLKYNHSKKTIYLGIADGSVFNANSAQTGGMVNLVNCSLYVPSSITSASSVYANHLYSATSITTTASKCIEIAGNTIREYHSEAGGSPYHSNITLNDTSLYLSAYGNIDISAGLGTIKLATGGSIELSSYSGFSIIYRGAEFSVAQTNGNEFTWSMDCIKANGNILATGGITAYSSSDIRLKTNITKLNCLNVIKSIGGTYEFDYIRNHKHSIGFIAQNVINPLLKDIVAKDDNGYLKINYWNPKLISLAFGALTEIDVEVNKLKARVRELENEVEYLKNKDYVLQ
uniref:Tail protein n=1 Tax=Siphoviridae sp. ctKwY15 TaxID=2827843 RepID=A0A8S5STX7_9CAUD|nr:MAG TPA: tail protein [Siphoviridae sp. ctKwY15]